MDSINMNAITIEEIEFLIENHKITSVILNDGKVIGFEE